MMMENPWGHGMASYDPAKPLVDGEEEEEDDLFAASAHQGPARASHQLRTRRLSLPSAPHDDRIRMLVLENKLAKLQEKVWTTRDEVLELRQETSDLQEYSNAKIARVTRYLGVLAEKAHRLDELALESEARLALVRKDRKKLFNDLLNAKGNISVFCRVRPPFEHEGPTAVEFPDDFLIRVNTSVRGLEATSTSKKEFEFDRVYGPHVGQGDFFQDVQPLVQSALDGYNVSIFAYGQSRSGKTYTMEGPSNDRGIFFRAFEELFDLSSTDTTSASRFLFYVTMAEIYNERVQDLLLTSDNSGTVRMGYGVTFTELCQERVDNPTDFARVYKMALYNQFVEAGNVEHSNRAHLILTIHIHYTNTLTGENQYSKLSMVDMVRSERLGKEEASGDRLTELLHINKSFSALGDVLSALTARKENIPYGNSKLTQLLAESLGGESKTLLILNISPSHVDVQETLASLHYAARARNVELSLGNRDTIKKWRDMANEARKEVYEKEKEISELQQEIISLKKALKDADDQCLLLFNEVQKAWKVAFTLQADHKNQSNALTEKQMLDREHITQLKRQIAEITKADQDKKNKLLEQAKKIQDLEDEVKKVQLGASQLHIKDKDTAIPDVQHSPMVGADVQIDKQQREVTWKLEEELTKRDELIERLHEENEKLFERLTDRSFVSGSPRVPNMDPKGVDDFQLEVGARDASRKGGVSLDRRSLSYSNIDSPSSPVAMSGTMALVKSNSEKIKTTPAGEYLTSALMDFNPDQYESPAAVADGANKLLMLVLAAVIKAGAAREHEMLAEIRAAVFSFIRRMEQRRVMDPMLVSRVRVLYIRSLLSRASELQSIKTPPIERFLEKGGSGGQSKVSSRGNSPARSPARKDLVDEFIEPFRVHLKQEKKSKFSSVILKFRGIDQETWKRHVTEGKLREITEEARNFAIRNKALAALFVHTPAGELQRQIRCWLADNFDFLSLIGNDGVSGTAGQLELLSTAIMDGWMAGLGTCQNVTTDALGQLLSDYTKQVYTSQLHHLKDIAATLATEEADDLAQVTKLRSALESVEHKRRKILQQMRSDVALLTKEEGGSPIRNPSTASEDARIASLMSLEDILKQVEELKRDAPHKAVFAVKKSAMLATLNALSERMPVLLLIDHPCAQKHIIEAQKLIELIVEQRGPYHTRSSFSGDDVSGELASLSGNWAEKPFVGPENDVAQWSVLHFNNGSTTPFVIRCGANSACQLVVKAQEKIQDKTSKEMVVVIPVPSSLQGLSLEEIKQILSKLPESFSQLALARTVDATRARYTRLYNALADRVPSLRLAIPDFDKENSRGPANSTLSFKTSLQ